jgi:tRNA G18 (ribose-2'-O)-methylase SpoU
MAVLFGGEAHGLEDDLLRYCQQRVTIPMRLGTDSLNVAVAAGIVLHHYVHGAGAINPGGAVSSR